MSNNKLQLPVATKEEIKWIKRLSEGVPTKEVAKEFDMAAGTFAYKLALIRERFQCENMASLIAYFAKNQLI